MRARFWHAVLTGSAHPVWTFIATARLNGHERAMLTTLWFLIGEKWYER